MAGNKRWSAEELLELEKNYKSSPIEEIMKLLPGRTKNSIEKKASDLGLLIRDGKKIKADKKIIVNVTEEHYKYLKNRRNQSRVIRDALNLFLKSKK